jgi:ribosomal-protein-alanine N-acetyltransferase
MSEITVGLMTEADVDAVHEIEELSFKTPWSRESFLREIRENQCARYMVVREDGKAIAYAGVWFIIDEGHITNIAVQEEARGRGIGKRLTAELLQILSNLGACYATLEVRVSNERAQDLYKSLGFVSVGKRKRYYEDNNEDAYLMVCEHLPDADPDYSEEPWIEKEEET